MGCRTLSNGQTVISSLPSSAQTKIEPVQLDVSSPSSTHELHTYISTKFGHLDSLVNNAAVGPAELDPAKLDPWEVYEKAYKVNVAGPAALMEVFGDLLAKARDGASVVNVSSRQGSFGRLGKMKELTPHHLEFPA